jgi:hypothetical protein
MRICKNSGCEKDLHHCVNGITDRKSVVPKHASDAEAEHGKMLSGEAQVW